MSNKRRSASSQNIQYYVLSYLSASKGQQPEYESTRSTTFETE